MLRFNRKQNCITLSTTEVECIAVGSECTQLIWMKNMHKDYHILEEVLTFYFDNLSMINISKNPIQNSTKHIDIHHHYIKSLVEDKSSI